MSQCKHCCGALNFEARIPRTNYAGYCADRSKLPREPHGCLDLQKLNKISMKKTSMVVSGGARIRTSCQTIQQPEKKFKLNK